MTDYTKILPKGKENAVRSKDLALRLGFRNVRDLQHDIAESRAAGQIICSSSKGGYYLPETREELQEFINTMERRAKGIFLSLHSARKAMDELEGQMRLDGDIRI